VCREYHPTSGFPLALVVLNGLVLGARLAILAFGGTSVSSYFPNPKNPRSFWTLRRVTTCSADALMKYSAVSSSRVRSVMVCSALK